MAKSKDRLLELLRSHAFARGEFTLASGAKSDFFIDCKKVTLSAEGHHLIATTMTQEVHALASDAEAVAGVELGGCPLASAVATRSFTDGPALHALYVRKQHKDHGTRKLVEGGELLREGACVVMLEDTVTTGGSTTRAIEKVRDAGYRVGGVVAVVDRLEGGAAAFAELDVPFASLFDRNDFMGEA